MASATVKLLRTILVAAATAAGMVLLLRPSRPRIELAREPELAGNEASGVFHRLSCRMYDADAGSPTFVTREEALAAGYRPCGICKP